MKPDDLAQAIREGAGTFAIDKIVIVDTAGSVRFRGTGLLRIAADGIKADMRLRGGGPPLLKRVLTERDYWKLRGIIAGSLPFSAAYVTPIGWLGKQTQTFEVARNLHGIELVTKSVDPVRIRSKNRALWRRFKVAPQPRSKPGSDQSFHFRAVFVDHPLPGANAGTEIVRINPFLGEGRSSSGDTFLGETTVGEYALIRSKNQQDLELYFRSKPSWKSPGHEDDRRKFDALLHGLAFATGIQPWPFRTTYSRGGGFVISDALSSAEPPPRTEFVPLRVNFGKEAGVELEDAIRTAAEFLEAESELNEKLRNLLFLFRQAGSAQTEIAILTTCMLLESLVRTIFKHVCEGTSAAEDALNPDKFRRLKESFLLRVQRRRSNSNKRREFERLLDSIKAAQMYQIRDIFQAVAERLNISWRDEMEPVFREWKKARNPIAHGQLHADSLANEEREAEEMLYGQSRIAGAFNMILLKLFGYSGSYLASVLEGTRRRTVN